MRTKVSSGYVIFEDGAGPVLLQIPDPNSRWGFCLADDDQTWDGGFGIADNRKWVVVADADKRISQEDRDRLGWILER